MITKMIILAAALLGMFLAVIFDAIRSARKLKEVEAERDGYKAANEANLDEMDELNRFKHYAREDLFSTYRIQDVKEIDSLLWAYMVVRIFPLIGSEKDTYVCIKSFCYDPLDESDRLYALSEAKELLDALNGRVSWRVSKDNG